MMGYTNVLLDIYWTVYNTEMTPDLVRVQKRLGCTNLLTQLYYAFGGIELVCYYEKNGWPQVFRMSLQNRFGA